MWFKSEMKVFFLLSASQLFLTIATSAQDNSATEIKSVKNPLETQFSKGISIVAKDSSYSAKVGFRFQSQVNLEAPSNDLQDITSSAMIRRSRLKFDGFVFNPDIVYKMEFGLSNSDIGNPVKQGSNASNIVLDAVVKWKAFKNTSIWFGQTKLPGNRERVISSQALQFVDRSHLNSLYNIDRDMGFQLHNEFKLGEVIIRDIYAVTMGEGRNITADNTGGLDYTLRVEVLPFGKFTKNGDYVSSDIYRESKPKISIGATYDYNDDASKQRGQLGNFLSSTTDLKTLFVDLMFKYRGISVLAEYADKNTPDPFSYDDKGKPNGQFTVGTGLNVQAGYLFKSNWEIAGRYTETHPSTRLIINPQYQYTLGVSRYVVGHNLKVQSDITLIEEQNSEPDLVMFRFQVEVAF